MNKANINFRKFRGCVTGHRGHGEALVHVLAAPRRRCEAVVEESGPMTRIDQIDKFRVMWGPPKARVSKVFSGAEALLLARCTLRILMFRARVQATCRLQVAAR